MKRALVLIDGEHYLPVTKSAIDLIKKDYEVVGAYFLGGTEKIGSRDEVEEYLKIPVMFGEVEKGLASAIEKFKPDIAIDLSDEPVVDYESRFRIACILASSCVEYLGSDFHFLPPEMKKVLNKPSIGIIGTGKRVGKTAVSAFIARKMKEMGNEVVVLTMGRGGPPYPEIIDELNLTPEKLLKESRKGKHTASDHWEDALMSRIKTVGTRRCGGGFAGRVWYSNMMDGAEVVNGLATSHVIVEGSGSAIPPVGADVYITVAGAMSPEWYFNRYLGPFRLKIADLIVITMWEDHFIPEEKKDRLRGIFSEYQAPKIYTVFRPSPLDDPENMNVFVASTAGKQIVEKIIVPYLEENYGCNVTGYSSALSNRPILRKDLAEGLKNADALLTELKGAAVDVATDMALKMGKKVIYMDNIPMTKEGDTDFDTALEMLMKLSEERFEERN